MRQRQARRPIDLLGVLRHLEEACPPVCERDRMRTAGRVSLTSPDTACTVAALSAGRLEDSMQMCELAEAEVRDGCRRAESVWMIVMKDS
jgi:hypothetical protein